jgi:hypothetical protein
MYRKEKNKCTESNGKMHKEEQTNVQGGRNKCT